MLIPNKIAREQNLPGSDVYLNSHTMYMKGINRAHGAAMLNYESYKAFEDLFLIKYCNEIENETIWHNDFQASGKMIGIDECKWPMYQMRFTEIQNIEYLKIGCGLELCLKAKLVSLGVVIHVIDPKDTNYGQLAKRQKNAPVHADEVMAISDYMYNGSMNILPGISEKSLQFSTLIDKRDYCDLYDLDKAELETIRNYRDLRNGIHLPSDPIKFNGNASMKWKDQIQFIKGFVRKHIIDVNRSICLAHSLHKTLEIMEYESNQSLKVSA